MTKSKDKVDLSERKFIKEMTTVKKLPKDYLTTEFVRYVKKRYNLKQNNSLIFLVVS